MTLIKDFILCIMGLSGGFAVGAGVFAFVTMIGIFPRLADRTNTAKHIKLYEDGIILGGTVGNLMILFDWKVRLGIPFLAVIGVFSGIYVGCLAMSLAEVLDVIPIFIKRANIKYGMVFIILAIALGKGVGSLFQFW